MFRLPDALKCLAFSAILWALQPSAAKASNILAMDVWPACSCGVTLTGGTYGWKFTVSHPIEVTALGIWSYTVQPVQTSHEVAIWDWSTEDEIADAIIPAHGASQGASAGPGSWQMVALPSAAVLLPGTYVIGSEWHRRSPPL
jgi:hypothetical protein